MTVDIAEFLLARLADDEAAWRIVASRDVVELLNGEPIAPRMIADCAAKRRIVQAYEVASQCERTAAYEDTRNVAGAAADAWRGALKLLAVAFEYHPDYREDWRP